MDRRDRANIFGLPFTEDINTQKICLDISSECLEERIENLDPEDPKDAKKIEMFNKHFDSEKLELPANIAVCDLCYGKGVHVNPSIDSNGLTQEDFEREGPDFREEYFSGFYDVQCYRCNGLRVICTVDRSRCDKDLLAYFDKRMEDERYYQMECEAEMRMGC